MLSHTLVEDWLNTVVEFASTTIVDLLQPSFSSSFHLKALWSLELRIRIISSGM